MTRRHLLNAAASSIAATALQATSPESKAALRCGQIGTSHAHAAGKMEAMRKQTNLWEVVGLAAEPSETGETIAAAQKAPYAGLKLMSEADLLATAGLQVVAVETRIENSCATALRCIQAGKHIHLDKPGALKHAEFKHMRQQAALHGLTVQMGYMLRYNPAFELLFQVVKEGWLGEITEIDASMGKLADQSTRGQIGKLAGGGMFELGCHVIDAIVTLLGAPQMVQAFNSPTRDDAVKDNQVAVLGYAKATAIVRCNHADPFGGPRRRFNVTGTEGTFEIVPLESGKVNLSLNQRRGGYKKGTQSIQLTVPTGRYDHEFLDLAQVVS